MLINQGKYNLMQRPTGPVQLVQVTPPRHTREHKSNARYREQITSSSQRRRMNWKCNLCTFDNDISYRTCQMCGNRDVTKQPRHRSPNRSKDMGVRVSRPQMPQSLSEPPGREEGPSLPQPNPLHSLNIVTQIHAGRELIDPRKAQEQIPVRRSPEPRPYPEPQPHNRLGRRSGTAREPRRPPARSADSSSMVELPVNSGRAEQTILGLTRSATC